MKLAVFTICLYFTAAESREYGRRVLHDNTGDVSLESQESVDIIPTNSVLTPSRRTSENAKAESKENKPGLDVLLKANYAVMPSGDKVDIPESIQGYRKCFGDDNLRKILEWIIDVCKKGLCNVTHEAEESEGEQPIKLPEPVEKKSKGHAEIEAEKESSKDAEEKPEEKVAKKVVTKSKKGKDKTKTASSKSKKKKGEIEEINTSAEDNDNGGRKEIGSGQSAKRSKVIPYKRERTELENVTFQFKALPSKEKDKFCKYLENDLLADPMETLKTMLGRVQFGDKKESGVHYDRTRGATLARIQSRTERETQILKWACEDRRDGQRKLYFPVKRYLPALKRTHRYKAYRRYGGSVVPYFKPTYPYENQYPREIYRPSRTAQKSDRSNMDDAVDDIMDTMDTVYASDSDEAVERMSAGSADDRESEIDNEEDDNLERRSHFLRQVWMPRDYYGSSKLRSYEII